jgi:hypothetical protein
MQVYSLLRKGAYEVVTKQWLSSSVIMSHYLWQQHFWKENPGHTLKAEGISDYHLLNSCSAPRNFLCHVKVFCHWREETIMEFWFILFPYCKAGNSALLGFSEGTVCFWKFLAWNVKRYTIGTFSRRSKQRVKQKKPIQIKGRFQV